MYSLKKIINNNILKYKQSKKIKFLKFFNFKVLKTNTYNHFYKISTNFNVKKNLLIGLIYVYSNININLIYKKNHKILLTKKFNLIIRLLELRIDVIICKLFFCFHIKHAQHLIKAQMIYLNNILCKKTIICSVYDQIQIYTFIKTIRNIYFMKITTKLENNLNIKQIKFYSKIIKNYLEIDFKILKTIILRIPYYTEITNPFLSLKRNFVKTLYNNLKYIYRLY